MYWPNGVPRVYAVNGPSIPPPPEEVSESDNEGPQEKKSLIGGDYPLASEPGPSSSADTNAEANVNDAQWAEEPITGVCASRTGHMFATMTESSMAVWQTKVRSFFFFFFFSAFFFLVERKMRVY